MKEIQHTNYDKNFVMTRVVQGLELTGSKIEVAYTGKNFVRIKLHRCDYETLCMFALGLFKEGYLKTNKNKLFNDAVKEVLEKYLKDVEE